ncbi:MAG: hypothetical protein JXA79_05325 [Deltaproteobacteria bacterium]|nr:hypothetical protein [Deltaproteobacteria bacterium]
MYDVLSPCGQPDTTLTITSPRLSALKGKTIGEIWNGTGKGEVVFPLIRGMMGKRYDNIIGIPYTEFPELKVIGETTQATMKFAEDAAAIAIEKGCDAVIIGVGS